MHVPPKSPLFYPTATPDAALDQLAPLALGEASQPGEAGEAGEEQPQPLPLPLDSQAAVGERGQQGEQQGWSSMVLAAPQQQPLTLQQLPRHTDIHALGSPQTHPHPSPLSRQRRQQLQALGPSSAAAAGAAAAAGGGSSALGALAELASAAASTHMLHPLAQNQRIPHRPRSLSMGAASEAGGGGGGAGGAVGFVAPAAEMKKIFALPQSSGRVSVAVHRIGRTLVLDGVLDALLPDEQMPPTVVWTGQQLQQQGKRAGLAPNCSAGFGGSFEQDEETGEVFVTVRVRQRQQHPSAQQHHVPQFHPPAPTPSPSPPQRRTSMPASPPRRSLDSESASEDDGSVRPPRRRRHSRRRRQSGQIPGQSPSRARSSSPARSGSPPRGSPPSPARGNTPSPARNSAHERKERQLQKQRRRQARQRGPPRPYEIWQGVADRDSSDDCAEEGTGMESGASAGDDMPLLSKFLYYSVSGGHVGAEGGGVLQGAAAAQSSPSAVRKRGLLPSPPRNADVACEGALEVREVAVGDEEAVAAVAAAECGSCSNCTDGPSSSGDKPALSNASRGPPPGLRVPSHLRRPHCSDYGLSSDGCYSSDGGELSGGGCDYSNYSSSTDQDAGDVAGQLLRRSRGLRGEGGGSGSEGGFAGYRRCVRWQVDDIGMLLGSDTLVVSTDGLREQQRQQEQQEQEQQRRRQQQEQTQLPQPQTGQSGDTPVDERNGALPPVASLGLHDVGRDITSQHCLDLWLTNVMSSVPATAICYHREGRVQGYQLVNTDELPWLAAGQQLQGQPAPLTPPSSAHPAPPQQQSAAAPRPAASHPSPGAHSSARPAAAFSPLAVKESAVSILRFLQAHCTDDASTYWLTRREGDTALMLFQVAAGGAPAAAGGAEGAGTEKQTTPATPSGGGYGSSGAAAAGSDDSDAEESDADEEGGGASDSGCFRGAPLDGSGASPFDPTVALLCFRIADRIFAECCGDLGGSGDVREARRLFRKCASLLCPAREPLVFAQAHKRAADTFLAGASVRHELQQLQHGRRAGGLGRLDLREVVEGRRAAVTAAAAAATAAAAVGADHEPMEPALPLPPLLDEQQVLQEACETALQHIAAALGALHAAAVASAASADGDTALPPKAPAVVRRLHADLRAAAVRAHLLLCRLSLQSRRAGRALHQARLAAQCAGAPCGVGAAAAAAAEEDAAATDAADESTADSNVPAAPGMPAPAPPPLVGMGARLNACFLHFVATACAQLAADAERGARDAPALLTAHRAELTPSPTPAPWLGGVPPTLHPALLVVCDPEHHHNQAVKYFLRALNGSGGRAGRHWADSSLFGLRLSYVLLCEHYDDTGRFTKCLRHVSQGGALFGALREPLACAWLAARLEATRLHQLCPPAGSRGSGGSGFGFGGGVGGLDCDGARFSQATVSQLERAKAAMTRAETDLLALLERAAPGDRTGAMAPAAAVAAAASDADAAWALDEVRAALQVVLLAFARAVEATAKGAGAAGAARAAAGRGAVQEGVAAAAAAAACEGEREATRLLHQLLAVSRRREQAREQQQHAQQQVWPRWPRQPGATAAAWSPGRSGGAAAEGAQSPHAAAAGGSSDGGGGRGGSDYGSSCGGGGGGALRPSSFARSVAHAHYQLALLHSKRCLGGGGGPAQHQHQLFTLAMTYFERALAAADAQASQAGAGVVGSGALVAAAGGDGEAAAAAAAAEAAVASSAAMDAVGIRLELARFVTAMVGARQQQQSQQSLLPPPLPSLPPQKRHVAAVLPPEQRSAHLRVALAQLLRVAAAFKQDSAGTTDARAARLWPAVTEALQAVLKHLLFDKSGGGKAVDAAGLQQAYREAYLVALQQASELPPHALLAKLARALADHAPEL